MDSEQKPQSQSQVELIVLMTMLAIFSLIGSVGNGLVIFVFQRVREKTTAQVFMIFLAIIDLFTCTVIIPLTMFVEYTRYQTKFDFLCKIYHFLITSKIPLSAFIMVAIAVDRYFCICHPLMNAITLRRARFVIAGFTFLAGCFGLITSFFYGVYKVISRIDHNRLWQVIGHNLTDIIMNEQDRQQQIQKIQSKVAEVVTRTNMTVEWDVNSSLPWVQDVYNRERCDLTFMYFSQDMLRSYKYTYNAIFPSCLVIVIILYLMIYRFMCLRRSKKLKHRLKMASYVNQDGVGSNGAKCLAVKDDEHGMVTEMSALSHSPIASPHHDGNKEDETTLHLLKETPKSDTDTMHYLSPRMTQTVKNGLSSSCSNLNETSKDDGNTYSAMTLSASNSCSHMLDPSNKEIFGTRSPAMSSFASHLDSGRDGCGTHAEQNKCRGYKKRDSVKRYKGKKRGMDKDGHLIQKHSKDNDPERLREQNRIANVKTALMLFTVNIVFAIAFGPAWLITLGLFKYNCVVFYLYFIYNVANPFIYAFMNHIFKAYMRNIFSCTQKTIIVVSH